MKPHVFDFVRTAAVATRNAILGANMASISLLAQPGTFLGYVNQALFDYKCAADVRGLPQAHVGNGFPWVEAETVVIPSPPASNLWFNTTPSYLTDLISLLLLCRMTKARRIFEIGTFDGYSACALALNSPPDAKVYTLDLPTAESGELKTTIMDRRFATQHAALKRKAWVGTSVEAKIIQLVGDSAVFDFSEYYGTIDLFFIDGAHSYEYVKSDTKRAFLCTREGGVVAWHDFGRAGVNGVSRFLSEVRRQTAVVCVPGGSLAYATV